MSYNADIMSPIDVFVGSNKVTTLGPGQDKLNLTKFNKTVCYHGDETGKTVIVQDDGNVEFDMKPGDVRGVKIPVDIAPIEKGETTTRVDIKLDLHRTS